MSKIPKIRQDVIDGLAEYLCTIPQYAPRRQPVVSAALLALTVELHDRDMDFPQRSAVAKHLDCSEDGVNSALATRITQGLITCEITCSTSKAKAGRQRLVMHRKYVPSARLLAQVKRLKRRL